jgi:hypothetical protein
MMQNLFIDEAGFAWYWDTVKFRLVAVPMTPNAWSLVK